MTLTQTYAVRLLLAILRVLAWLEKVDQNELV